MDYDELYIKFKKDIPESAGYCNIKENENQLDDSDGIHILFGMVVVPYFEYLVDTNQTMLIKKVSSFFECMAKSKDIRTQEVLDFTILEQLADEGHDKFEQYQMYMKNETIVHCTKVEKYFNN